MDHKNKNRGRGSNLTPSKRREGGLHSAAVQQRDERGRFAGKPLLSDEEEILR